jgi:uncharacterized integral membrane protein
VNDEQVPQRPSGSPMGSPPPGPERRRIAPELVGAAVLAVVLVIFIVQNDEDQKVSWVVFSRRGPVWAVILVSAVIGYLIGQLIEFGVKRRRRERGRGRG